MKKRLQELKQQQQQEGHGGGDNKTKQNVNFVRLFDNNQYFISDHDGISWGLHDEGGGVDDGESFSALNEELSKSQESEGVVEDIAILSKKSWIVIRSDHFIIFDKGYHYNSSSSSSDSNESSPSTNIQHVQEHLTTFYKFQKQRQIQRQKEIEISTKQNEHERQQWEIHHDANVARAKSAEQNKRTAILQQTEEIANLDDEQEQQSWLEYIINLCTF